MTKTRIWIIVIASVLVLSVAASFVIMTLKHDGMTAEIVQDGKVIKTIDLSEVTKPYSFDITWSGGGSNTVSVENGRIRVSCADCPDGICVDTGWISDGLVPIVCIPHRLVIRIVPGGEE